jgi:DNA-binding cell septation regulator SpoVG
VDDCTAGPNLRRLRGGLHVQRESFWPAASGHYLVHLGDRRFLCCDCPSRRIRSENQIIGESHAPRGSCDGGLNMQITQVNIRIANEDLVKGYVDIVFDNCFIIEEIGIIKGPTGLFISFPAKKQRDGTYWGYCFSSQRRNTADDRANHTGGVREGRCRRRFIKQPQKSKHQASRERVSEIKFRLRSQFRPDSLLNKVDP